MLNFNFIILFMLIFIIMIIINEILLMVEHKLTTLVDGSIVIQSCSTMVV